MNIMLLLVDPLQAKSMFQFHTSAVQYNRIAWYACIVIIYKIHDLLPIINNHYPVDHEPTIPTMQYKYILSNILRYWQKPKMSLAINLSRKYKLFSKCHVFFWTEFCLDFSFFIQVSHLIQFDPISMVGQKQAVNKRYKKKRNFEGCERKSHDFNEALIYIFKLHTFRNEIRKLNGLSIQRLTSHLKITIGLPVTLFLYLLNALSPLFISLSSAGSPSLSLSFFLSVMYSFSPCFSFWSIFSFCYF